jgi:type II secretory pathway pseudopilin PulG
VALDRRGAVLLEAIVALAILSVAGTAAVTMVSQSADAVRRARESAGEVARADAFLHAAALWTREDLDRRLGRRRQGPWTMFVQRPTAELYEVTLADSAGERVLLRTSLHRPEPSPAWPGPGEDEP